MTASVLSKVVTAHESPVANRTDELFLAGVCSPVTGELIRACKLFFTALPITAEWLLTWRNTENMVRGMLHTFGVLYKQKKNI